MTQTAEARPAHHEHQGRSAEVAGRPETRSTLLPSPAPRMHSYVELTADRIPHAVALECEGRSLTYLELDHAANQLAHHLRGRHGIDVGSRVGILLTRSEELYVAMLGVLKSGATFVPIDPGAPADRIRYISEDAGLTLMVTSSHFDEVLAEAEEASDSAPTRLTLDAVGAALGAEPRHRVELPLDDDPTAYVIYTSGSTGRPKGVAVAHSSISNFLNVVPRLYGVREDDRVYQGMTVSFDFSIEEIWPTWGVGATLVAGPTDGRRLGTGLTTFLDEQRITMLYCVPTVLATLDRVLPRIHTVNVGGEACPQELVDRWAQGGRRMLNTYGPTEATVTCIWAELYPGKPVTIGRPLPTYTAVLLDERLRPVPDGDVGEICIGGPGVAQGYLNRPELTAERFIADPSGLTDGRIYRTGDLGRVAPDGEILYLGRADDEVKIRGHRVDLGEIESQLLESPQVAMAAADLRKQGVAEGELAVYVVASPGVVLDDEARVALQSRLRDRLPSYMVPSFLEVIDEIPMLPSGKTDRGRLPELTSPRLVAPTTGEHVTPSGPTETAVADIFGAVLKLPVESISAGANLFTELGGHSLVAATIISRLRQSGIDGTADLAIPDLYENPDVRALSRLVDASAGGAPAGAEELERIERVPMSRTTLFALAQVAAILVPVLVAFLPLSIIYSHHRGEVSVAMAQHLVLTMPLSYLLVRWLLPVLTARLAGRLVRPGVHPLYGRVHLAAWMVERAMASSPMTRLAGSPWADRYLRLCGASVGEGCHIGSANISLPSLVSLESGCTIGYHTHLSARTVRGGLVHLDEIVVGHGATVEANSVISAPAVIGARAVVMSQSMVSGADVPADEIWGGSPARRVEKHPDPHVGAMLACEQSPTTWPEELRSAFGLGLLLLELAPMLALLPVLVIVWAVLLNWGEVPALVATLVTGPIFVASISALVLYVRRFAVTRAREGIFHLRSQLGFEKWLGDQLLQLSLELSNSMYATLFTSHWLRMLGAHVGRGAEVSTISNVDPDLLTLDDGSFVADMASVGSAIHANGHVALRHSTVGRRAFVGNASYAPAGARLGDDSLLGALSVPPVKGTAPDTAWLGLPPIFLPAREIHADVDIATTFEPSRARVVTRWVIEVIRATLPATLLALSTFGLLAVVARLAPVLPMAALVLVTPVLALAGSVLVVLVVALLKWLIVGRYRTRTAPLWSYFVRRSEFVTGLYEAAAVPVLLMALQGSPLLNPFLRLFGARIGHGALIETTYLTEFDLVRVARGAWVGPEVSLQTHLFEDRVMKLDTVEIGRDASVGTRAIVLYSASVGRQCSVGPLSLIMKGEHLPLGTAWVGVPARRVKAAARPEVVALPLHGTAEAEPPTTRLPVGVAS